MGVVKLKPINRICPHCGDGNYMRIIEGKNVGKLNVKCINCNSYFNYDELNQEEEKTNQNLRECPFCGEKLNCLLCRVILNRGFRRVDGW